MDFTERIVAAIDGKKIDRVPTFSASLDDWPVQQVLGKPLIPPKLIFKNPVSTFIIDRWGRKLKKLLVDPFLGSGLMKRIEAAVELGFDCTWAVFEGTIMLWDSNTLAKTTGCFMDWIDDGHGNMYFMYRGPAISTPEEYDAWEYHQDIDELAHMAYKFFKKAMAKYGDKICIIGEVSSGNFEIILQMVGFQALPILLKKNREYIQKLIKYNEEYTMKTQMAVMDAGVKVLLKGDDMAYKTGPMLNPKLMDELFGDFYTRYTKTVHDRGGRVMIHSCGDNTKLFDYFIKWGFDGGHAYENTSNVDIFEEKKKHGDVFTIVGGVGIDYTLTERSKPQEVEEEVRHLIKMCAPGGRYLLGPAHDHPDMDIEKVRVMIEAVHKYGKYPISM
ncbi:MAG: hypothetical protein JW984_12860 [Deltaproteobacteria bacterium]|uniref:Uroporphyrinogen decarboxylase (URO-D) domain-containing protein n=1 Tax=Candidatus Zymogenus saltonus TaxID=2844893 RepID=A0A9D8KH72_9DELT|nr:hypothetical protein [Candidatus Zymogenus saltonus]